MKFVTDIEYIPRRRKTKRDERITFDKREFIAWDGEGWTDHVCKAPDDCVNANGACKHHYYLFGASTGDYISGQSLGTVDCFRLMVGVKEKNPDALHVAFSFKYDIDMIFRDIPPAVIRYLTKNNRCKWGGFYIECLPGKWLQVTFEGVTCRIYDLFSFFACSFVNALKTWKVGSGEEVERIERGKSLRNTFTLEALESDVIPYWKSELRLLVLLASSLRSILYSAGIRPSRWHGPGAVADFLYRANNTKDCLPVYGDVPSQVLDAGQYAYAGGRFEAFRIGYYDGPIYSADINSAYPYAMSKLPNMATGKWVHYRDVSEVVPAVRLGLFHVSYEYGPEAKRSILYGGMPGAGHYRYARSGTVHYRHKSPGTWVHMPEFRNLQAQVSQGLFSKFEVIEAWIYEDDGTYPFAWVEDIYRQRLEWKKAGNAAQLAAKLGINSLYGKLAQRVGGKTGKPTWHNLEMAGHITSVCRAMLYSASWQQYSDIIAYQTDGIYSTRPLDYLPNGSGTQLGQWEVEEYTGMVHLQSGVYWLRDKEGNWLRPKTRGIPQQHMSIDAAMQALETKQSLRVTQTQFIRFGLADMRRDGMRIWRTWQQNEKEFSFGGEGFGSGGKRIHIPQSCKECVMGYGYDETLHTLCLSPKGFPMADGAYLESAAHYLPWRELGTQSDNRTKADTLNRWGESGQDA